MSNQYPTAGRVTGSAISLPAGDLPPLPGEPVAYAASEIQYAAGRASDSQSASDHPSVRPQPTPAALAPGAAFQAQLDGMADDVLEKATVDLRRQINAAHAQFTLHVRELERRAVPERVHGLYATGWLKRFCHMSAFEASGTIKTGRAMTHMPTITDGALTGAIPPRSTQLLGQARDRHRSEFIEHEAVFADVAAYLSITDLRTAISHWEQQVNYPKAHDDITQRDRRRSLYLAPMLDGMGDIRGTLTAELFHTVQTAIDATVNPTFLDGRDNRTAPQRRADALGDVCRFYLDHSDTTVTSGGERPHVTVTVDYETLKGQIERLPEMSGMPVTPETVRRITCDASIIPMVLGSESEPLDVGRRTRTIPTAIRRALEHRDGHCTWTGCGVPVTWCDAHHKIHWAEGGRTSLDNLMLLCRKHHTGTHNGETPPPDT
jgi:hypothetical protein